MEDTGGQDHISDLPGVIKEKILSILPIKTVVATSALSKEWTNQWKTCLVLDLDSDKSFTRTQSQYAFANWVYKVLEQHEGMILEKFRISHGLQLSDCFTEDIDNWVAFALKRGVTCLELDLGRDDVKAYEQYKRPFEPKLGCFEAIVDLTLKNVGLTEEEFEFACKKFTLLQKFHVASSRKLGRICIEDLRTNLEELKVASCSELNSIHICGSNLKRFAYVGNPIDIHLSSMPLLVQVSLSEIGSIYSDYRELIFSQISSFLSQLQTLALDLRFTLPSKVVPIPSLPQLTRLELYVLADGKMVICQLHCILKSAPNLQSLVLKIQFQFDSLHNRVRHTSVEESFKHQVKRIELKGAENDLCRLNALQILAYLKANINFSVLLINGIASVAIVK